MSHKKCPLSEIFLESIYGIFLFLFGIVHESCLCTKFWIWMSKVSHLNFSLNLHFFVKNLSSVNPYFLVRHFLYCCLTGNAFQHINFSNLSSFWFNLKYTFFSCLNHFFPLIPFSSCVSLITVSLAMPSTTSNTSSQMPSVNGWHLNNTTKQHLPWLINRQTMSPPCCPPATSHLPPLAACCLPLATQHWCWPGPIATWFLVSHLLQSVPRSLSKPNKIR